MLPTLRRMNSLPETLISNQEDCCSTDQTHKHFQQTKCKIQSDGADLTIARSSGIQEDSFQFKRSQSYKIKRDLKDKHDEGRNNPKNLLKVSTCNVDTTSESGSYDGRRKSASFSEYGVFGKANEEESQILRRNQSVGNYNYIKKGIKTSNGRLTHRASVTSLSEFSVLNIFSKELSLYKHLRGLRSLSYTSFHFGKMSLKRKDSDDAHEQKKRWEKRKTFEEHRKSSSFSNLKDFEKLTQDIYREEKHPTQRNFEIQTRKTKQYVGARSLDDVKPHSPPLFQRSERFKRSSFHGSTIKKSRTTTCIESEFAFQRNDPFRKPIQEMLKQRKQDYDCNRNKVKEPLCDSCDDCNEVIEDEEKSDPYPDKNLSSKIEEKNGLSSHDRLDGETEEDAQMRRTALRSRTRTRSSIIVEIPTASIQMDLHSLYLENLNTNNKGMKRGKQLEEGKKKLHRGVAIYGAQDEDSERKTGRFSMIKHKFKNKERSTLDNFKDFLEHLRSNLVEVFQHDLEVYKDSHWSTINQLNDISCVPCNDLHKQANISDSERGRYEALWELFYAEVSYLLDHLLVLQNVFSKPLQHAKEFGFLHEVDDVVLFPNLDFLIEATSDFAERLLKIFKSCGASVSKSTEIIVEAFNEFDSLLTPQYKEYCLNYQNAKEHLSKLKKEDELFVEFIKWGEQDDRCQRRRVEDFLVAPLQHLTKYPLLLKAIRKHTSEHDNYLLTKTISDIEQSIKSIEKKISSLINIQRMQEIYEQVKWPALTEYDHKSNIPDFVRSDLNGCRCDTIFRNPNRSILLEGNVTLADNNKSELYLFLFNDMLLVTKCRKKIKRRLTGTDIKSPENENPKRKQTIRELSNTQYLVQQQPIPLDRLKLYDCDEQASTGFKNSFCVVHFNRYHQPINLYTFQLPTNSEKTKWTTQLKKAKESVSEEISSDEEFML